jgi:hypothetical protein
VGKKKNEINDTMMIAKQNIDVAADSKMRCIF